MLSLLQPDMYTRVHSLFEAMDYHLAVMTVLTGKVVGKIYVDDPITPQTSVLIPSNQHRFYVAGSTEDSAVNKAIIALIEQKAAEQTGGVHECIIYYIPGAWKPTFDVLLEGQETFSGWRQFYRLRKQPLKWKNLLRDDVMIRRIDETLLTDLTLQNRERVIEEIYSENPSLEHFLQHNVGYYAQLGSTIVGWCMAEYWYQNRCELGIETVEAYQRKGIATLLASTVIEHTFAEGATEIGWHCWVNNIASIATARKLGFEKASDYPVCYCLYRHRQE